MTDSEAVSLTVVHSSFLIHLDLYHLVRVPVRISIHVHVTHYPVARPGVRVHVV
jgi:hypothetical protein